MDELGSGRSALVARYWYRLDIPLLLAASATLNVWALTVPFLVMKTFIFFKDDYTLFHSINEMWQAKYYTLAVIITLFSLIFPFFKLGAMTCCWLLPLEPKGRAMFLGVISWLGKWSMLDVFVMATLLTLTQAKALLDAEPRKGLYLFASAILLSMVASLLMDFIARGEARRKHVSAVEAELASVKAELKEVKAKVEAGSGE
ncbi:MAG: paraquat-inducible protein A [Planctomycetota bacterium]